MHTLLFMILEFRALMADGPVSTEVLEPSVPYYYKFLPSQPLNGTAVFGNSGPPSKWVCSYVLAFRLDRTERR
ncbi:hypothetical protein OBBRIDRAFT_787369 [Obba rivulosa]|uniref:Uncharacterized protein n=1 Tax=Obba rivulosa TaxID=1052685 RepID=A0A8E2DUW5_9APHY|nr:hypothetical protein OBBRIDRAFT_787369 [Obba rivulosa]